MGTKLRIAFTTMAVGIYSLWIALGFELGSLPTMRGFIVAGMVALPVGLSIVFVWGLLDD